MLPPLSAQRLQERRQIALFLLRELQRLDIRIQILVRNSALVIKLHHLFQRLQTAIMHVRRGVLDFAQRGSLENSPVARVLGHREPPHIGLRLVGADADIGIRIQREIAAFVAAIALGLVEEHLHPAHLARRHRAAISGLVPVVWRVAGNDRPLEARNRLRHPFDIDLLAAERLGEQRPVTRDVPQPRHHSVVRIAHFDRIGHRPFRLLFERPRAPIPKLRERVDAIDHGGRAAAALLPLDTRGHRRAVGEPVLRRVARRAAHGLVRREPPVEIQLAA